MGKIPLGSFGFLPRQSPGFSGLPLPVEVAGLGHESVQTREYRWNRPRHGGDGWVIQYTLAGRGRFAWTGPGDSDGLATPGPGDLFLTAPDMEYEYSWVRPEPWEFLWIMVRGDWAGHMLRDRASRSPVWAPGRDSRILSRLHDLFSLVDLPGPLRDRRLSEGAYGLLLALDPSGQEPPLPETVEDQARSWLRRHWHDATGGAMAARFGYHPKYFITWFKNRTGRTPEAFLQAERMDQAALRLASTRAPVGAIARALGYADPRHFARVFRASRGMGPRDWRQLHAGGQVFDAVMGD